VNQRGERMPYRLFSPSPVRPGRTYPLVVFLHGASGSGTDNARQLATLPIDRSRIYVTGHSMGGAGTWHMLAHRPRFFAAAAAVCGRGHPETAATFKDVPIWNFHGLRDEVEPVASSRAMIDALHKAGGRPRHTDYADLGHNVFAWVYTEPALIEWLFAQRRPESKPPAAGAGIPDAVE
jgi:predicted peptidase